MAGSIRKRVYKRNGRTWARFVTTVELRTPEGARVQRQRSFALERDARAWLKHQQASATAVMGRGLTVAQLLDYWMQHIETAGREPATLRGYRVNIRTHILPTLGPLSLDRLTPLHVQALVDRVAASHSPQTVAQVLAPLRAALNQARRWQLVSENVATLVQRPRASRQEVAPLTVDEARRFLEATAQHRLGALFATVTTLGLRQSEALALQWGDVQDRALTVRRKVYREAGQYYVGTPKSQRSRRTVPLPSVLVERLREHRHELLQERIESRTWTDLDLVFPNTTGGYLYGPYVTRELRAVLERAGLPRKRFHDLRHTAASCLYAMGADVKEIADVLGHANVRITAELYTHAGAETAARTAARMDEWRNG